MGKIGLAGKTRLPGVGCGGEHIGPLDQLQISALVVGRHFIKNFLNANHGAQPCRKYEKYLGRNFFQLCSDKRGLVNGGNRFRQGSRSWLKFCQPGICGDDPPEAHFPALTASYGVFRRLLACPSNSQPRTTALLFPHKIHKIYDMRRDVMPRFTSTIPRKREFLHESKCHSDRNISTLFHHCSCPA
ncbi:hypothetical protein [uncultured Desulfovibrio sp.]|uniref:hypothetical protein n=1 Tax=uncultured Desulfovibrio sp. TaxID=167968 RepID=UPI00260A82BC|nr:hypothetical protein [uncultured Desulfovibrio sp.]